MIDIDQEFENQIKYNQRKEALHLAFSAALQYGAFDKRLTPKANHQENLGEHWESICSLADAIFDYTTQDEKLELVPETHDRTKVILFPTDTSEKS